MNQGKNAFAAAPEAARENHHHPISENSKNGKDKILEETNKSLKIATASGGDINGEHNEPDKLANAEAYANSQFEADYQTTKEKAREEMKEQMCSGNP